LGTTAGLEARLVPERGYDLTTVPKAAFPRRPNRAALKFPASLGNAVSTARRAMVAADADVVVGFGGYVASPAYLAARRLKLPIVIHEQNARPGLANRLGARMTPYVATTFAATALPHAHPVGMPLRQEISQLDRTASRGAAMAHFGLDPARRTLLVFGGSLGAQRLNEAFSAVSSDFARLGVQVLHLTGAGKGVVVDTLSEGGDPARYRVVDYTDRMDLAYAAADLAVCRSGAVTVCELAAVGLPAIYVPLPIGYGEQRLNAASVVAAGGGQLVNDADLTPAWVRSTVIPLMNNPALLRTMATAAASVGERDADEYLADFLDKATGRS